MSAVATEDTTLVMTRAFEAAPERVFDAWLSHDDFNAWIGPEGMSCEVPVFEPRVGGRYEVMMRMSSGQVVPVAGEFREIARPTKLVFTWGWANDPARQSLITLTFRAAGDKTEMTLRQEGLASVENREAHRIGWNSAFNKLARFVTAGRA